MSTRTGLERLNYYIVIMTENSCQALNTAQLLRCIAETYAASICTISTWWILIATFPKKFQVQQIHYVHFSCRIKKHFGLCGIFGFEEQQKMRCMNTVWMLDSLRSRWLYPFADLVICVLSSKRNSIYLVNLNKTEAYFTCNVLFFLFCLLFEILQFPHGVGCRYSYPRDLG